MAKIFTIFAAKDGSGATTFTVNMACELQKKSAGRVLIINLSLPRDIAISFGENGNIRTINDLHAVLKRGSTSLVEGLLLTKLKNVGVVERNWTEFDPSFYDYSLPELDRLYDFILIDGGSVLNEALVWALKNSNTHCMVLSSDLYAMACAERKVEILAPIFYPITELNLILNKTEEGSSFFVPLIKKKITTDNLFSLRFSQKVYASHFKGMPVATSDPKEEYLKDLGKVVSSLVDSNRRSSFTDLNWSGLFIEPDINKFAPSPFHIPRGERVRGRVVMESIDTGTNNCVKQEILNQLLSEIDLKQIQSSNLSREEVYAKTKETVLKIISTLDFSKLGQVDKNVLLKEVLNEALGLGAIEEMIEDPSISEIMVNSCDKIYFEREGKLHLSERQFTSPDQLMKIVERIVAPIGRRIDESSPMVDARLCDGSRVNVIIPPLSLDGPVITIRKFPAKRLNIERLVEKESLNYEMAKFLAEAVKRRLNIMISGGTGSGKTTLLNILSSFIPEDERIVTIEDAAELRLHQEHVVRLEARPSNIEGRGAVAIRDLVKNALRMRPDRIVVGECRGGEALDMLQAMNTGHEGSLTTIHANSVRDSLARLETLVMFAEVSLPSKAIREQIVSAIDLVIQLNRLSDGSRKITNISEVTGMEGDVITMQELFIFKQSGVVASGKVCGEFVSTGFRPRFYEERLS